MRCDPKRPPLGRELYVAATVRPEYASPRFRQLREGRPVGVPEAVARPYAHDRQFWRPPSERFGVERP